MTLVAQVTPHFNGFWTKQYLVRIEVTSLRRGQDGRNTPNKDSMFGGKAHKNQIINKTSNSKYMMRNYSIFVAREEKNLARRPKATVEEQKTNHFKFTYLFHERAREKCLRGNV